MCLPPYEVQQLYEVHMISVVYYKPHISTSHL